MRQLSRHVSETESFAVFAPLSPERSCKSYRPISIERWELNLSLRPPLTRAADPTRCRTSSHLNPDDHQPSDSVTRKMASADQDGRPRSSHRPAVVTIKSIERDSVRSESHSHSPSADSPRHLSPVDLFPGWGFGSCLCFWFLLRRRILLGHYLSRWSMRLRLRIQSVGFSFLLFCKSTLRVYSSSDGFVSFEHRNISVLFSFFLLNQGPFAMNAIGNAFYCCVLMKCYLSFFWISDDAMMQSFQCDEFSFPFTFWNPIYRGKEIQWRNRVTWLRALHSRWM